MPFAWKPFPLDENQPDRIQQEPPGTRSAKDFVRVEAVPARCTRRAARKRVRNRSQTRGNENPVATQATNCCSCPLLTGWPGRWKCCATTNVSALRLRQYTQAIFHP